MTAAPVVLSRWRPSPTRFARLVTGLAVFGVGEGLIVAADLGMSPWTVLAEGLSLQTGLTVGTSTVLVSLVLLLVWIPLRQRPGLGTLANALLIGVFMDLLTWWLDGGDEWDWRLRATAGGVGLGRSGNV